MQEKDNEVMAVPEIGKLMNELTYRKYVLSHEQIRGFFQELSIPDYVALYIIRETARSADIYYGRTYLKDLAEKMRMTIRQTSKMVGKLRDRGLLTWSHDGNGSEGTYVTATELGLELLSQQENALKTYYGKVIDKFGKENLLQLLYLMKQLETVMSSEMEEIEDDGEPDE